MVHALKTLSDDSNDIAIISYVSRDVRILFFLTFLFFFFRKYVTKPIYTRSILANKIIF